MGGTVRCSKNLSSFREGEVSTNAWGATGLLGCALEYSEERGFLCILCEKSWVIEPKKGGVRGNLKLINDKKAPQTFPQFLRRLKKRRKILGRKRGAIRGGGKRNT